MLSCKALGQLAATTSVISADGDDACSVHMLHLTDMLSPDMMQTVLICAQASTAAMLHCRFVGCQLPTAAMEMARYQQSFPTSGLPA